MITARDVKKLGGYSFTAAEHNFVIPPITKLPRSGMEAYGIPIEVTPINGSDKIKGFFKIFKLDIPVRQKRIRYLVYEGINKWHPLFKGVPFAAIHEVINGIEVKGHIAHRLDDDGNSRLDEMQRIKDNDEWTFSLDERKTMAGQLLVAVSRMEKHDLVHGDISPKNVMITSNNGTPTLVLCDFDGFHHPSQPLLPRKFNNTPCRPLGLPGFRYTEIVETPNDDDTVFIETDRFAMGSLACEIMAWESGFDAKLDRENLLDDEIVRARDITIIPSNIRKKWPDGFDLLHQAISVKNIEEMPSAEDWLKALGVSFENSISFKKTPMIRVYKKKGNRKEKYQLTVKLGKAKGDLNSVSKDGHIKKGELKGISYTFVNRKLHVKFDLNELNFLIRDEKRKRLGREKAEIAINPNDVILSGEWYFFITDEN